MCSFRLNRKKMNKKWKRQPFGLKAFFNGEKLLERSLLVQKTRGQIHMIALRGEHRARRLYSVSNCWAMCFHSAPRIVKAALNCGRFSALTWGTKDPFDLSTAEPCPPGPKRRCPVTFSHVLNGTPPPGVRSVISNKGLVTLWWNAVLYTQIKFLSGKRKKSGRQSAGRHCLSMIACTQEYDFGCRVNIFQLPEECDVSEDFVLLSGLPHNLYVTKMVTVNGLSMSKKPPQFNFYQIN